MSAHRRRLPRPAAATWPAKAAWAFLCVIAALVLGVGVVLVRAQTVEEEIATLAQAVIATPAPTPEPTRYVPSSRGGRQAVQELAEAHFPPDRVAWAIRVAVCESSLNPDADTNPPYVGLWQIDPGLHGWRVLRLFGRWRSLYEAEVNAAVAADILADVGPGAWPACGR